MCIAFNTSTIKNCPVPEIFPTLHPEEQCQQREWIGLRAWVFCRNFYARNTRKELCFRDCLKTWFAFLCNKLLWKYEKKATMMQRLLRTSMFLWLFKITQHNLSKLFLIIFHIIQHQNLNLKLALGNELLSKSSHKLPNSTHSLYR